MKSEETIANLGAIGPSIIITTSREDLNEPSEDAYQSRCKRSNNTDLTYSFKLFGKQSGKGT
jgi:hypothetical protein